MHAEDLVRSYPRLYHMAEVGSWPSIQCHGLLSTTALLDLFDLTAPRRQIIESSRRKTAIVVQHPKYGTAVIRDQKPMSESKLESCLEGLSPRQWYELLNGRVFFWPTRNRLERLLGAALNRGKVHTVITVDTAALLSYHGHRMTLSPINSGATLRNPRPRGRCTFLSIAHYPFEDYRRRRGWQEAVAEIAVEYAVPNIRDVALSVNEWTDDGEGRELWHREALCPPEN